MEDADALCELLTPEISRWMASWPFPFTAAMARSRIDAARSSGLNRGAMHCVIECEKKIIGSIEVDRSRHIPTVGELGFWIGEKYQGFGYAREAAGAMVAAAFPFLDVAVIEAGAQPANRSSFAVMQTLGMRYAGQRLVYAAARERNEVCHFYAIERPQQKMDQKR
jgi:ribosomal-protein-alanine N-acetyltransferase